MRDLARLVRIREIWERREKAQVARAMEAARLAGAKAEERAGAHSRALSQAVGDLMLSQVARTATWEAYSTSRTHAQAAALQEEATRGVWRRAKQELEISERLDERRREAEAIEADRRTTKALDEIAATRHGRSQ